MHPLQSTKWGEFREKMGVRVVRAHRLLVTIHPLPYTPWSIGYAPKGPLPDKQMLEELVKIAKLYRCIYIKCEPLYEQRDLNTKQLRYLENNFYRGRPLFTKHNFVLDVTPDPSKLLAQMKPKTRYNIRVAEKYGVEVKIDNSQEALGAYLNLMEETTKRQKFYAHGREYQRVLFESMHRAGMAELLVARYKREIVTAWVLLKYGRTLYYPYGASSRRHREVMANNLVMWQAIMLAKKWGLKKLDMWGALSKYPNPSDPWYGFHKFKEGYGGELVEYVGTWDYAAKPTLYYPLRVVEWLRWWILRLLK